MKPPFAAVLLLAILGGNSAEAEYPLPFTFDRLKALAEVTQRRTPEAIRVELQQTAAQARATGDLLSEAHTQVGLALLDDSQGHHANAETFLRQAGKLAATTGDTAFTGRMALWLAKEKIAASTSSGRTIFWGRLAESEFRASGDARSLATTLDVLATATASGPARRKLIDEALLAATKSGDAVLIAKIQASKGQALGWAGDVRGSIENLRTASQQLEDFGELGEAGLAYLALARSYLIHGQEAEAMFALQRGEALLKKIGDTVSMIAAMQQTGTFLAGMGQRAKAIEVLERVSKYAEDPQAPRPIRMRMAGVALGYANMGDYQKAAAIAQKLLHDYPSRAPLATYWILSSAYFHLKHYPESIDVATRGISRSEDPQSITNLLAHRWRARSLDQLGRFDEAASDILEAVRLQDAVRAKLMPDDESKRAFGDALEHFTDDAIAILWHAGRQAEALTVAEQSRGRAFLDLIASRDSQHNSARTLTNSRLASSAFATAPTADQLKALAIRRKESILAYWVHPQATYIWLISPGGKIHGARARITDIQLRRLVDRARSFSYKPDLLALRELHRLIIQPVQQWLPKSSGSLLSVLPHDSLLQLPFAALLDATGHYLVEQHTLRTVFAAGFLAEVEANRKTLGPMVLIGAPTNMPSGVSGKPLQQLPGAKIELDAIAALSPGKTMIIAGGEAVEKRFLAEAPAARAIHFATHAIVNEDKPFESFLALSERGKLMASEIYDLHLTADLVVLSSCRSGSGQVSADGLLGFTRAFLYAGAATVVAPLLDIPDEPTVRLVEEFYRQYNSGATKSRSLRAAQLKLLHDLRSGRVVASTPAGPMLLPEHPALWAGFVLQGAE